MKGIDYIRQQKHKAKNKKSEYDILIDNICNAEDVSDIDLYLSEYDEAAIKQIILESLLKLKAENKPFIHLQKHYNIDLKKISIDYEIINEIVKNEYDFLFNLLELSKKQLVLTVTDPDLMSNIPMSISDEKIITLLEEKGLMSNLYIRKTFFGLLNDLLLHLKYSMDAISDGTPRIAFSLIRKPFIENIFYFERMLVNANELINDIQNSDPKLKEITSKKQIENFDLIKQSDYNIIIDPYIIDMRIDNKYYSLKSYCDKSLHVVSSYGDKKNKSGELNFIYETDDIRRDYIDYFYLIMAYFTPYISRIISLNFEKHFDISTEQKQVFFNHYYTSISTSYSCLLDKTSYEQLFKEINRKFKKKP